MIEEIYPTLFDDDEGESAPAPVQEEVWEDEGGGLITETERPATGTITVPMHVLEVAQIAPSGIEILQECIDIAVFLCEKNIAYGDSALNPIRAFSKADSLEQIRVRIDDKISRAMRGTEYPGDNDMEDLLGYLVLYRIGQKRNERFSQTG